MEENINNAILTKDHYFEKGKEIIKIILNNGEEAYFVGEVVRNKIIGIPYKRIDIYTSANTSMIEGLFAAYKVVQISETDYCIGFLGYDFYLHCYKNEIHIDTRKSPSVHYSKNLVDYLQRTDFSINALAISYNGKISDFNNSYTDLKRKKVRLIGRPKQRINEKPERILIAFDLVSTLNFKIEQKTAKAIKGNKAVEKIAIDIVAFEMRKIISGPYFKKAFNYIISTGTYKRIPYFNKTLKRLNDHYRKINWETFLLSTMLLNKQYDEKIASFSEDDYTIKCAYDLALANPKSNYDSLTMYRSGLQALELANAANNFLGKSKLKKRKINKQFNALPIKKTCDLAFKGEDVLKITRDDGGEYLVRIIEEIEYAVLLGHLTNEYNVIRDYVVRRLPEIRQDASYDTAISEEIIAEEHNDVTPVFSPSSQTNYQPVSQNVASFDDESAKSINRSSDESGPYITQNQYQEIMSRLDRLENDKIRKELDDEIEQLVNMNLSTLNGLDSSVLAVTKQKLRELYRETLIESNPKYSSLKVEK